MSGSGQTDLPRPRDFVRKKPKELLDYAIEGTAESKGNNLKKMVLPSEFADVNLGYG